MWGWYSFLPSRKEGMALKEVEAPLYTITKRGIHALKMEASLYPISKKIHAKGDEINHVFHLINRISLQSLGTFPLIG
jgi:hypothetical protein